MWSFLRQLLLGSPPDPGRLWQRRDRRRKPHFLNSNLGEVADLSGFGARIKCRGKPDLKVGQSVRLILRSPDSSIMLTSEVTRIRRAGPQRFEIALQFVDVQPATQAALHNLARISASNRRSGPVESPA